MGNSARLVRIASVVLGLGGAACSHKSSAKQDTPRPGDTGPTIDGPAALACTTTSGTNISVRKIGTVQGRALLATSPPNDGRLFVLEDEGRIRIFDKEQLQDAAFLDISSKVVSGGEQGMLGLAFHPQYATNHKFYVDYTANNPDTTDTQNPWVDVVEEYTASSTDITTADPASGTIILSIPDYATNHNAGMLEFGSDGFLYISTGDGGAGGDPNHNGQNTNALLAKILRIDVDNPAGGKPYGIPTDNPFATSGGAPEVFVIGVRNPWRWSFDRKTGDMWIGDVGQEVMEELDVLPAGLQGGANLGWSMYEANYCCQTDDPDHCNNQPVQVACDPTGKTFPQFTHDHTGWNSIIGGQVYRGTCYPDLDGIYFFSDNGGGVLDEAVLNGDGSLTVTDLPAPTGGWPQSPSSIHADSRGELYETTTSGDVFHIEAGP